MSGLTPVVPQSAHMIKIYMQKHVNNLWWFLFSDYILYIDFAA